MSFLTASAILRGKFLIEPTFAKANLPLVRNMLFGEAPKLAQKGPKAEVPKLILAATSDQGAVYSISTRQSTDRLPYGSIAMLNITGPILKYGDDCGAFASVETNDLLQRLFTSERVNGIILNIDSPGGQADGTGMIYETLREITKSKPVISIIQDGYAASAGMWIAAGAQEIYCTRSTDQVGSIGAYCTLYDFREYFNNEGIAITDVYAPQSIDKNKDYKDAIDGNTTAIEEDLKFLVDDFIAAVKTSRGARLKQKGNEPFTGKMYYAKDAQKMGLIDGIKSMSGVVQRMNQLINLRK